MNDALTQAVTLRRPTVEDGAAIWRLVKGTGTLDLNSAYAYLLLAHQFSDTCRVAVCRGEVVGVVTAYLHPRASDTLFVWQIGVDRSMRGLGLATALLHDLLRGEGCRAVRRIETTISPGNGASRALFQGLAKRLDTPCEILPGFGPESFPAEESTDGHEREELFRIGPFGAHALAALPRHPFH
ncbi:diaminobutyrate acetyltransferase [Endothiovibrio diazotrophicus]